MSASATLGSGSVRRGARGARVRWGLRVRAWGLCFMAGFGLARCTAISEEEVLCEEGIAKIKECCGPSPQLAELDCYYAAAQGGCLAPQRPQIAKSVALCLLRSSCAQLRGAGVCDPSTWPGDSECGTCHDALNKPYACCSRWSAPSCK